MKGPTWLKSLEEWPPMIVCQQSSESESEKQLMKQIMQTDIAKEPDDIDKLLERKKFDNF